MKKKKTPEIRARELFKMIYPSWTLDIIAADTRRKWIKLGKFVLSLETKWGKSKNKRQ